MSESNILAAIEQLNFALENAENPEELKLDLSNKILDNRIITLEGYLRYLDSEGIPKIKKIIEFIEEEKNNNDRSNIL